VNLAQLHAVRDRLAEDLVSILAAARERITLTHVARFSQQPMPDAMTLVAELITASEERRCNEN
jgi:hypothetical protein